MSERMAGMYCTVTDLKAYLGASGTSDDEVLDSIVRAASAAIDSYCNRWFEARAQTRTYGRAAIVGQRLYLDADLLRVQKLINGDEAETELLPGSYYLEPRNTLPKLAIVLMSDYTWTVDTDCEIVVQGDFGYSFEPPADIVQATIRLAGYMYRLRDAQVFDVTADMQTGALVLPKGMPADVKVLLAPYTRIGL